MRELMRISAVFLVLGASAASNMALAAEPIYAPGSRIGFVVIEGLKPARAFSGFEDEDKGVSVIAAELPEAAYTAIETALTQKSQGAGPRPQRIETALGPAFLSRQTAQLSGEATEQFAMM